MFIKKNNIVNQEELHSYHYITSPNINNIMIWSNEKYGILTMF